MGKTVTRPSEQDIIDSLIYGENGIKAKHPEVGLVIGIRHQGQNTYYAFGTRTKNGKEPLDSSSIFEIGSITKAFTALLLAEAIQDGKVRSDDLIDQYLPEETALPAALRNKIKLTDLASHQSGLPNLCEDAYFAELFKQNPRNPFQSFGKAYLYDILKKTESIKSFGQYEYNNYAYALLGDILERISGQSYTSLVEDRILRPFQMRHTTFGKPKSSNVAGLYNQQGEPQEDLICDAMNPAGGLKSNAVDLMIFAEAHMETPQSNKAIQLTQQTFYKDKDRTVGLGWDIKDDYYQKNGETLGNSTLMRYSVTKQIAVAVLSNHLNEKLVSDAVDFIYRKLGE